MYIEFKRELYRHVLLQEVPEDMNIRLLEAKTVYPDEESIRMIRQINYACFREDDRRVGEDMLCISWGEGGPACMKYWKVRELYGRFLKEGWQSVLPEIMVKLQEAGKRREEDPIWRRGYEQSRNQHIVRLLNFDHNRRELENCIYWRFGDIALVLYLLVYEGPEDCITMKLNRGMTESWGLSDAILLTNALLNTRSKMPPRLFHGDDIRFGAYRDTEGIFMPGDGDINITIDGENEQEGIRGYRLTTNRWFNGAAALFYPCVREQLAEMIGGDYFVGFTSIHEAVIHPVNHKVLGEMRAAIQHINAVFDQRENLSSRIYRYCAAKGQLLEV